MNNQNVMIALVVDNNDPDVLGRVLIELPELPEGPRIWARVVTPYAGDGIGQYCLPEIGDEVLAIFTDGTMASAYVLGGLWGKQKPPPDKADLDTNAIKLFKTRSGSTLLFDDTDGSERMVLVDKNENYIEISTGEDKIAVTANGNIELYAKSVILLEGDKISMKANTIEIKADSSLSLEGGSTAELKAGTVNIN